jgi:endonuclease-3
MPVKMTKARSDKILSLLYEYYGETVPDLSFRNIFELTIAVVLSAQTTDRQVNGVTKSLFARYPDFKSLGEADCPDVEKIVKSTGFFRTKTKNIIALSQMVCSKFGGILPDDLETLIELPGVGRKSANVILSIGYGKPGLAVDTHVLRISNRLGYGSSKSPLEIEKNLCSIIDPSEWKKTHLLFIKHGRVTCNARHPECGVCPVAKLCNYYKEFTSSSPKRNL